MGFLDNIFGSSGMTYPTTRTGVVPPACGTAPYQPSTNDGLFNKLFAPTELAYPVPGCTRPTATPLPDSHGPTLPGSAAVLALAGCPTAAPAITPAPASAPVASAPVATAPSASATIAPAASAT